MSSFSLVILHPVYSTMTENYPIPAISLRDYHYELPDSRIAAFPLAQRDQAKLLVYRQGEISHTQFFALPDLLPEGSTLVFNDTKVIHARLYFRRQSGALIELLLLAPAQPQEVAQAMLTKGYCVWECMIGNKKRWKNDEILSLSIPIKGENVTLRASWIDRENNMVALGWDKTIFSFSEILEVSGELPLPPYFGRKAEKEDEIRYQTVYSRHEGAVAAPTAGLHFTENVLQALTKKKIAQEFVTLHVSAGTFQPVKHDDVRLHAMHREQIIVTRASIERLVAQQGKIIAVGTTSMRVLETLYWWGAMVHLNIPFATSRPSLTQFQPYECAKRTDLPNAITALKALLGYMDSHSLTVLAGDTEIFILPSYTLRICGGLITNFHLPETTLMLLIAALVGDDWRKIYNAASENEYRFLSYGDSSLLLP